MNSPSFTIYDASAGSGKTYTLVKEYLKILFNSPYKEAYKNILAITFTNKAVGEMKARIIDTLRRFSSNDILTISDDMFTDISHELSIEPNVLHLKSKRILESIVHNYAAFDISTIDKFTQKVIRTFAYDLHLPLNFEVELDTETLLNKAVDNLIARAGTEKELTQTLIEFALEKTDDDKSWDVAYDFNQIAPILINENHIWFVENLKDKTLDDFKSLKELLQKRIKNTQESLTKEAEQVLTLIDEAGLEHNDFNRSSLPKHFIHIANKNYKIKFDSKWQQDLLDNLPLYPKRVTTDIAAIIDSIQSIIIKAFENTKQNIVYLKFLQNFSNNLTPLSVLNEISKEVAHIKEEQNLLLISEFNNIISNHIKEQPAPFIYERIGEKFKHYFIDEFQDTSTMQWENIIPLIGNALSGESTSAMLVGDAKQAIYRWRGGKAEQFIGLYNHSNPFYIEKTIKRLPVNYRSFKQIVSFNNQFFKHLSSFAFSTEAYAKLYKNSTQQQSLDQEGYVNLSFLELTKEDDKDICYPEKVLETINSCLNLGYSLSDICVLTRKKKEGVAIANYLSEAHIDIISSETLLIDNSPEIKFIINLLKFLLEPKNLLVKIDVLSYLAQYCFNLENKHAFYKKFIDEDISSFFNSLIDYDIAFDFNEAIQLPLYETVELIIHSFNLVKTSNAYVQFFLDFVLDFTNKNNTNLLEFINYYERKKDNLSIVSPEGKNAVQIMTIHKSKGLEFPVVIFPYADLDIYKENNPKIWFPLNKQDFNGFEYAYLNYNSNLEDINKEGAFLYSKHQSELELDNVNLLYVALTRPIEQLYIISSKNLDKNGNENLKNYSGLFINYLKSLTLWNDNKTQYEFGSCIKTSKKKAVAITALEQTEFISTPKKHHNIKVITNSGLLWDTSQKEAIEKGNLIHNIMAQIKTSIDVENTLRDFTGTGVITDEQSKSIKLAVQKIMEHPKLSTYFNSNYTVYNEKDIITKDGIALRPDRLNINNKNEVIIIDYKTGHQDKKHSQQLQIYADALNEMEFIVTKKILVYINDTLTIKEV